jgi:putative transposase
MPRPLRRVEVNGIYHASPRGNNGRAIFVDETDRRLHLYFLTKVAARWRWQVLGYCQMTTHYHLVVRLPELGLSEGMRWLQTEYSRWTNQRHGHSGHLYRQHFDGRPVESDEHLHTVLRYVDLNALDIDGIDEPAQWPWGSYRAHVGLEHPPAYLDLPEFHRLFGNTPAQASHVYARFVREGLTPVSDTGV